MSGRKVEALEALAEAAARIADLLEPVAEEPGGLPISDLRARFTASVVESPGTTVADLVDALVRDVIEWRMEG